MHIVWQHVCIKSFLMANRAQIILARVSNLLYRQPTAIETIPYANTFIQLRQSVCRLPRKQKLEIEIQPDGGTRQL